jgi:hypothetical protein
VEMETWAIELPDVRLCLFVHEQLLFNQVLLSMVLARH